MNSPSVVISALLRLPALACRERPAQSSERVIQPIPAASARSRSSGRAPSSRIQVRCGKRIRWAACAVAMTRSSGSLYVVMKTSTVAPSGGGGGSPRCRSRHMVSPNSSESTRLYVSARTSGTAIHHADQLIDSSHRQAT